MSGRGLVEPPTPAANDGLPGNGVGGGGLGAAASLLFVDLGFAALQLFRLGDPYRNTHGKEPPENRSDHDPRDRATLTDLSTFGDLANRKLPSLGDVAGCPGFTLRGWRVGDGRRLCLLGADGGCKAKRDRHDDGRCFQGAFLRLGQDRAEATGARQPGTSVRRFAPKRGGGLDLS